MGLSLLGLQIRVGFHRIELPPKSGGAKPNLKLKGISHGC
jgi:hypothetical protein